MAKLLNLFRWKRHRLEQDLDRELRHHLDRRVDDLMASGLTETEARREATIELGDVSQVQEEVRETWVWRWLDNLARDIRYAARILLRGPGFTLTAVLSLALGIGANAAIFSLFDQLLLRPLPGVREPARLVLLDWRGEQLADGWGTGNHVSYPLCRDLQKRDELFDGVFCRHPTGVTVVTGGQPQPVRAEIVSGSYFPVLGVQPELGRLIDKSDNVHPGAHPVVVLSHTYWKARLGGAPDVVGRTVRVNNYPMTVIGIAAAGFRGVDPAEIPALWIPAMMKRQATPEWDRLFDRRTRWMHVLGRLKRGITAEQAKVGLQPWFKTMLQEDTRREGFPSATKEQLRAFLGSTIDVLPAARGRSDLRRELERPLWVLMGGTTLLLLLACLNVASLLLARGAARSREVTARMALGASRRRITGQLLVESLLLAVAGGLLGLIVAPAVSRALLSFLGDVDLSANIDHRVVLFAFLVSMVTGGLCGIAPAVQADRLPLIAALKDRSTSTAAGGMRLRKALVVGQMAFTLILLIGAGLFVQTLARLHTKGPGFASRHLVSFYVNPLNSGYTDAEATQVIRGLLTTLQDLPVVERAAVASEELLTGGSWNGNLTIQFQGRSVTDSFVDLNWVSPGFFATLGTRVIAGRDFDERDVRDSESDTSGFSARSVIVNQSVARRYFGNHSPIGHRLGFGDRPDTPTNIEIVGVVEDFNYRGLREQTEQAFFPFWEGQEGNPGVFYLKVRAEPTSAFAVIREAVGQLDPTLPVSLRTIEDQIDRSLTTERMLATLSSGFGAIALLLSVVGLYGVMSFVVTRRTQEIGIRLALGATRSVAVWLIVRDAVVMVGAGTAMALPCIWALGRLVVAQLFGVRAVDGPTIAVASGVLALIALGAAMLPAWRAASISPTEALRLE